MGGVFGIKNFHIGRPTDRGLTRRSHAQESLGGQTAQYPTYAGVSAHAQSGNYGDGEQRTGPNNCSAEVSHTQLLRECYLLAVIHKILLSSTLFG